MLCTAITLALISQLLFTFAIEKPTTTAKLEKELELSDIPEVMVCINPGYNPVALKNHGYHISSYWRGALQPFNSGFVGWNGGEDENKSSQEMLEEVLLLPNSTTLALAGYTNDHVNFEKADVTFRNFILVGRCMVISPPLIETNFHRLLVGFNTSTFDR